MWILIKNTYCQYLGLEAKIGKSKTTLLSQTFEFAENKVPLFFHFWPLGRDIKDYCVLLCFAEIT